MIKFEQILVSKIRDHNICFPESELVLVYNFDAGYVCIEGKNHRSILHVDFKPREGMVDPNNEIQREQMCAVSCLKLIEYGIAALVTIENK